MLKSNIYTIVGRDYLSNILENVKKGNILIHKYHRPYQWTDTQVVKLFDSIIKGYPIGSLIFWEADKDSEYIIKNNKQIIIDGVQRINALYNKLFKDSNIIIDLELMRVTKCLSNNTNLNDFRYLDFRTIFDTYRLMNYIENLQNSNVNQHLIMKYVQGAKEINRRLKAYEIPYVIVNGGDISDIKEIIARINGTPNDNINDDSFDNYSLGA